MALLSRASRSLSSFGKKLPIALSFPHLKNISHMCEGLRATAAADVGSLEVSQKVPN